MDLQNHKGHVENLLKDLGENPEREGLLKTPERYLKSMQFLLSGYDKSPESIIQEAIFHEECDEMVVVRDIEFYSTCEHHLLPFYGKCHVGYIPNKKVVGLSKIPRLVECFSRRLQVQERLTRQIAMTLQETLNPQGVGVVMQGYHLCMMMRGVQKQNSFSISSSMQGCFRNLETRNEFLAFVRQEGL